MNAHNTTPRRPQVFRLRDLRPEFGLAGSTIWKMTKAGTWPKPIKLTGKSVGWLAAECDEVLRARAAGLGDDEIRALVQRLEAARRDASTAA
jgi:prophage regulatory protein